METKKETEKTTNELLEFISKQSAEINRIEQHNRSMYIWVYLLAFTTIIESLIIIFNP